MVNRPAPGVIHAARDKAAPVRKATIAMSACSRIKKRGVLRRMGAVLVFGVLWSSVLSLDARADDKLVAWIDVVQEGGQIEFRGHARAAQQTTSSYEFRVIRIGPAGRATTFQEGWTEVAAGGAGALLATVELDVEDGAGYEARLDVKTVDGVQAHAVLTRNPGAQ